MAFLSVLVHALQEFLTHSRAYWVSKSLIAWNVDAADSSCYLFASTSAALSAVDGGIQGWDCLLILSSRHQDFLYIYNVVVSVV